MDILINSFNKIFPKTIDNIHNIRMDITKEFIKSIKENNIKNIEEIIYRRHSIEYTYENIIIEYFDELFPIKNDYVRIILYMLTNKYYFNKYILKKINIPISYYLLFKYYHKKNYYFKVNFYFKKYWNSNKNIDDHPINGINQKLEIYHKFRSYFISSLCYLFSNTYTLHNSNKKYLIYFILMRSF